MTLCKRCKQPLDAEALDDVCAVCDALEPQAPRHILGGQMQAKVIRDLAGELPFLWREYVCAKDEELTPMAIELKRSVELLVKTLVTVALGFGDDAEKIHYENQK